MSHWYLRKNELINYYYCIVFSLHHWAAEPRGAWDENWGRNYFPFQLSRSLKPLHRGSATQSFKVQTKMLGTKATGGCADSSQKENSTSKGKISAILWLWTIPSHLHLVNYALTLIAYEMSMHPNPFVVGCTGGMTKESNSTLVWSPGASSCSFLRT